MKTLTKKQIEIKNEGKEFGYHHVRQNSSDVEIRFTIENECQLAGYNKVESAIFATGVYSGINNLKAEQFRNQFH